MMKSNDGIFVHRGNENEVRVFLGNSLNKHFSRKKKIARLLNEESSSHLCVKQVPPKRIKAAIKRCSLK